MLRRGETIDEPETEFCPVMLTRLANERVMHIDSKFINRINSHLPTQNKKSVWMETQHAKNKRAGDWCWSHYNSQFRRDLQIEMKTSVIINQSLRLHGRADNITVQVSSTCSDNNKSFWRGEQLEGSETDSSMRHSG